MSGKTISQSETRIEALKLQSSAFGVVIPWVRGVNRIAGNLAWYGGFKAIPHTETQGGKGGVKVQNTSYTYSASVMMGLCGGPIAGIPRAWRGKSIYNGGITPSELATTSETWTVPGSGSMAHSLVHAATFVGVLDARVGITPIAQGTDYIAIAGVVTILNDAIRGAPVTVQYQYTTGGSTSALDQLGLSFIPGVIGQAVWSGLATFPVDQQIGYSGLALVAGQDYDLGTGAQIENHTFEVVAPGAYALGTGVPDVDISVALRELLTDAQSGAGFPASMLDDWSDWSDFIVASNLLMSPALVEQHTASDVLATAARYSNTGVVWSGGKLKMVPYGDETVTANGRTYTPDTTPVYELDDECYTPATEGDAPVKCQDKSPADRKNHVRVEFNNRANQYQTETAEAEDLADIEAFGRNTMDTVQAPWICDVAVARLVAQILMQRSLCVNATYTVPLPVHYSFLECMDIVTLTDSVLQLSDFPVRITEISEDSEEGDLVLTCEDYPPGQASAALYPSQSGQGFQHDYNVAPGPVEPPVIFEAPGALTVNGLELYIAATGTGAGWGGCRVWVSVDGTTYKLASTINGGSRYGQIRSPGAGTSGTVPVQLITGKLLSGSAADAAALNTLCFIQGAFNEYLAYETATLVGALSYDLGGATVRGIYGTAGAVHAAGEMFVRVDDAIGKSGPIDLGYVGKTVHVKLTSFNVYGGAEESLAGVTDYTYTITGAEVFGNAGASALAGITSAVSDNVLSRGEKPPVILDYTRVTAEQSGIDSHAAAYGITTEATAYDTALAALTTYLGTLTSPTAWNDVTGDTTIVGTTFRSTWAALYAARQALLNKIDQVAGTTAGWLGVSDRPLDLFNLVRTPAFESGSAGTWAPYGATVVPVSGHPWTKALQVTVRDTIEANAIPVRAGETFYAYADISAAGTPYNVNFGVVGFDAAGTITEFTASAGVAAGAGWTRVGGAMTLTGATTVYMQPWIQVDGFSGFGAGLITNMYVGRAQPGATLGADWAVNVVGAAAVDAAIAAATVAASAAAGAAASAASDATAALAELTGITSDNVLSVAEKPAVIIDWNVIAGEQAGIDAQATNYGVTTEVTTYDAAVAALAAYLGGLGPYGWADLTPGNDTSIVGSTFRGNFQSVYTSRQAVLDKISANAKARLGALATLSQVDTPQIVDNAATDPLSYFVASTSKSGTGPIAASSNTVTITNDTYTNSAAYQVSVEMFTSCDVQVTTPVAGGTWLIEGQIAVYRGGSLNDARTVGFRTGNSPDSGSMTGVSYLIVLDPGDYINFALTGGVGATSGTHVVAFNNGVIRLNVIKK